jgi:hypothetical protein
MWQKAIRYLALLEEQIVNILDSVPVFVITDSEGLPLSRSLNTVENEQPQQPNAPSSVIDIFLSSQEAQAFLSRVQAQASLEMTNSLQITVVSLGEIYQQLRQSLSQQNRVIFAFQPDPKEVESAMALLRQNGQQVTEFRGVPIFLCQVGATHEGYVSIRPTQQDEEIIPAFLSMTDAMALLNQVKQQFSDATIQVADLDKMVQIFHEKDDEWLTKVELIASEESRKYVRFE